MSTTASLEDAWEIDDVASSFEDKPEKKNKNKKTRLLYFQYFAVVAALAESFPVTTLMTTNEKERLSKYPLLA